MKRPVYCEECQRPILAAATDPSGIGPEVSGYVVHDLFGCDTGCCGHWCYLLNAAGEIVDRHFEFDHPGGEDAQSWAETLLHSYWPGVPLDWEQCEIVKYD